MQWKNYSNERKSSQVCQVMSGLEQHFPLITSTLLRHIIQAPFQEVKRTLGPSQFKEAESGVSLIRDLIERSTMHQFLQPSYDLIVLQTLKPPPPFGIPGKLLQMCSCSHTLQSHTLLIGPPLHINTHSTQTLQLRSIFNLIEVQ